MKLVDIMNGPIEVLWVIVAIFIILSIVLISGHGSFLIAGYNTATKEEKEKYDKRKLCKVVGYGMAIIALFILIMALLYKVLPASFAYVFLVLVIVDCAVVIILSNTICKR